MELVVGAVAVLLAGLALAICVEAVVDDIRNPKPFS